MSGIGAGGSNVMWQQWGDLGFMVEVDRAEDGRPFCPCCWDPMTSIGEGRWQCPRVARMRGMLVGEWPKELPPGLKRV